MNAIKTWHVTGTLLITAVLLGTSLALLAGDDAPQVAGQGHPRVGGLNAYCRGCHDCDRPTAADPCLGRCPRHGGGFAASAEPGAGPETVVIDQLARLYGPVVFDHRLHADMSALNGGCANCHHESESDGVIPPCRTCHAETVVEADLARPSLKGAYHRQCLGCHRDWSHETACGSCHEEGVAAGGVHDPTDILSLRHPRIEAETTTVYETSYQPAPVVTFHHRDHVDLFGLACVDCHHGESCGGCHDEARGRPALERLKSCNTCHSESDCAFCHDQAERPPFDHGTSAGWPLARYHAGLACADCHGPTKTFRSPSTACRSCHIHWAAGSFDHRVTGLVLSESHAELECGDCHPGEDFTAPPACADCHGDERAYPADLPGKRRP